MKEKQYEFDEKADVYIKSEMYDRLCKYGQGWVADEALAIALFAFMQSEDPMI